jgi:hypothetical protein
LYGKGINEEIIMKQIISILFFLFLFLFIIQCGLFNKGYKINNFKIELEEDKVGFYIDEIEIIDKKFLLMGEELSIIDKGKKVITVIIEHSQYEQNTNKITNIVASIPYKTFINNKINGEIKARFSFKNDDKEYVVKEINFGMSEDDMWRRIQLHDEFDYLREKSENEKKYQNLQEAGLTEDEKRLLEELTGLYVGEEYVDFEHSNVTNSISISFRDNYNIDYYIGGNTNLTPEELEEKIKEQKSLQVITPFVGLIWSGEIMQIKQEAGNTTILTVYFGDTTKFKSIKMINTNDDVYEFYEMKSDQDDWSLIEKLKKKFNS